jgi:hypothetical protein
MTFSGCMALTLSLAISAEAKMPADFFPVDSSAWESWLEEELSVSWHGIPLGDVLAAEFGTAEISVDDAKKLETKITFDATGLSRRKTLWRLSQHYGFTPRWEQKERPRVFLDLLETRSKVSSIGGVDVTTMTHVMRSDYRTYVELRRADKVARSKRIGDLIYYCIEEDMDLPFENGATAWFTLTKRYKTILPEEFR